MSSMDSKLAQGAKGGRKTHTSAQIEIVTNNRLYSTATSGVTLVWIARIGGSTNDGSVYANSTSGSTVAGVGGTCASVRAVHGFGLQIININNEKKNRGEGRTTHFPETSHVWGLQGSFQAHVVLAQGTQNLRTSLIYST